MSEQSPDFHQQKMVRKQQRMEEKKSVRTAIIFSGMELGDRIGQFKFWNRLKAPYQCTLSSLHNSET